MKKILSVLLLTFVLVTQAGAQRVNAQIGASILVQFEPFDHPGWWEDEWEEEYVSSAHVGWDGGKVFEYKTR